MRSFENVAKLVQIKRERGLCNVPLKMMHNICEILNIDPEEMKHALLRDYETTFDNFFDKSKASKTTSSKNLQIAV